jgi:hypothetical protein
MVMTRMPLWRTLLRELLAWWSAIVLPHLDAPLERVPEMLWDRVPQATREERARVAAMRLEATYG